MVEIALVAVGAKEEAPCPGRAEEEDLTDPSKAVSRNLLYAVMTWLRDYRIAGHVHDEVIIEAPQVTSLEEVCALMGQPPEWLPGICLRADGYCTEWYCKK